MSWHEIHTCNSSGTLERRSRVQTKHISCERRALSAGLWLRCMTYKVGRKRRWNWLGSPQRTTLNQSNHRGYYPISSGGLHSLTLTYITGPRCEECRADGASFSLLLTHSSLLSELELDLAELLMNFMGKHIGEAEAVISLVYCIIEYVDTTRQNVTSLPTTTPAKGFRKSLKSDLAMDCSRTFCPP